MIPLPESLPVTTKSTSTSTTMSKDKDDDVIRLQPLLTNLWIGKSIG